uniref:Uncharacterized protein n=1 Tax=Candidatus Kentrum sp. DK TaxID=2126562 RepID=A0A450S196_9GAMM|nr:MAG: hypothetical protein BECKDK2373C_GA0170839_101125 [Candidatus Kentron sp. DK]
MSSTQKQGRAAVWFSQASDELKSLGKGGVRIEKCALLPYWREARYSVAERAVFEFMSTEFTEF